MRWLPAVAAALATGALGQRLAEARSRRRFPMPGRLIDVDGTQLHVVVDGSGPTVLMESGLGGSSIEWAAVASELSQEFTVVRYDRPGFGWSPPESGDRSPCAAAHRIRALLTTLEVPLPVILVGHSLGGVHVRLAAALHPDMVGGLVLVDPSHEDMLDDAGASRSAARMSKVMSVIAATASLGTARLAGHLYGRTVTSQVRRSLDAAERTALKSAVLLTACSVAGLRATVTELSALPAALRQVKEMSETLAPLQIPVTLISADAPAQTAAERSARTAIRALHEKQVGASPFGRLVLASDSGHLVPLDEPGLVARCVRETAAARSAGSWEMVAVDR